MFDAQSNSEVRPAVCPMHAQPDHPKVKPARVGILVANLGTPDGTDYWSCLLYTSDAADDPTLV